MMKPLLHPAGLPASNDLGQPHCGCVNPWTHIPLADYEGHMEFPAIGQAAFLAAEFRQAVAATRPRSVALLGCAGGNGLEALHDSEVERVVCVDINPEFLAALERRHGVRLRGLECALTRVKWRGFVAPSR